MPTVVALWMLLSPSLGFMLGVGLAAQVYSEFRKHVRDFWQMKSTELERRVERIGDLEPDLEVPNDPKMFFRFAAPFPGPDETVLHEEIEVLKPVPPPTMTQETIEEGLGGDEDKEDEVAEDEAPPEEGGLLGHPCVVLMSKSPNGACRGGPLRE
jgi:hypothetical protein